MRQLRQADLLRFARESGANDVLGALVCDLAGVAVKVAAMLNSVGGGYAGTQNVYGENQLKADVAANELFLGLLKGHEFVGSIASEELEKEEIGGGKNRDQAGLRGNGGSVWIVHENSDGDGFNGSFGDSGAGDVIGGKGGAVGDGHNKTVFSVAFDPLDGSSLVESNLAVGSIVGIYPGYGFLGRKGDEQVAAMMAVYGPRLTLIVTFGKGVMEFFFDGKSGVFKSVGLLKVAGDKKIFAPGNLRACGSEEWYVRLLEFWAKNGYTLRYSGGMVPDVNQILKKGGGIFTYPGYKEKPEGKLRLLYECAPMALIMEQAGGAAVCGERRILDLDIKKLDQRVPIVLGSKEEVERVSIFTRKGR